METNGRGSEQFDVVVVGGGPAGSTVASFLRLMGHDVLVLERDVFPRHHIGESMIAATIDILAEVGLEEPLAAAGFPVKSGGCFMWGQDPEPWCIRFDEIPGRPTSYQVKRAVFDKILLDHCSSLGVDVRQGHRATEVLVEGERVTGVRFQDPDGTSHDARAHFTVDASGLTAFVARKLSRRVPAPDLKNMCVYGYWRGDHPPPAQLGGDIRESDRNNIIVKMIEDGWLWFIPLGNQEISVGFVSPADKMPRGGAAALESFLLGKVASVEEWQYLLRSAEYTGNFHTIKDWSYRSESMAGPGYFAVGDASCFVDPILSSGVYLAVLYAKMAAIAINTLLRNPSLEGIVRDWYEGLYVDTYSDYLNMAHYWYRGARHVDHWMNRAQEALQGNVTDELAATGRSSFIALATGNAHAHPDYVLGGRLESFPFPVQLRKDPRGRFLQEAQTILLAHADKKQFEPQMHPAIERSAKMMSAPPEVRKLATRILAEQVGTISERFGITPVEELEHDKVLRVSADARFSLEIVDDTVAMVVTAPNGKRRRLTGKEVDLLSRLDSSRSLSHLIEIGSFSRASIAAFCEELLDAQVLIAASD